MEFPILMRKNEEGAWVEEPISTRTIVTCSLILLPDNEGYYFYVSKDTEYEDKNGNCTHEPNRVGENQKKEYREKYYDKLKNYFENE